MLDALMPADLDALDHAASKAMLLAQREEYTMALSSRATEIAHLKLLVEKLRRMLFGLKSEKVLRQIEQLELQLEELEADSAVESDTAALARAPSAAAQGPHPYARPRHVP